MDAVTLPGGRTLVVRPVEHADLDGLADLYRGLDLEDQQFRFFTAFRTTPAFLELEVTTPERGGVALVAEVEQNGCRRLVGEADYTPLPNGDGDLALTVARDWRGWLGPYLLDALLRAADDHGVPNLEADVLLANRRMLALLRARGYAVLSHDDWTTMRVLVGTAGRTPTWPAPHDRPRVLVEVPGGRWHAADELREAGMEVVACLGPDAECTKCPVLAGRSCPLAAEADVVVVSHPVADERWCAVQAAHPVLHPGVPVFREPPVDIALVARLARARTS